MIRKFITSLIVSLLAAGCVAPAPSIPANMPSYDLLQRSDPQAYTQHVILLHNLQRMMDQDLTPADRAASLELVVFLGGDDAGIRSQLATMLQDPKTPPEVTRGALNFLLRKDYPDMAGYVVQAMPSLQNDPVLHGSVLEWLSRHPTPEVLAQVVAMWASEPSVAGPSEERYRQAVEKMTGRPWSDALLDAVNTPGFLAAGPAIEVLSKRLGNSPLRARLEKVPPKTEGMKALLAFLVRFDSMPTTAQDYDCIVHVQSADSLALDSAARMMLNWSEEGYRFNIRDLHLLSRLSRDPLRKAIPRAELIAELERELDAMQHSHISLGGDAKDGRFSARSSDLSMADLWNIKLLHEFLSRKRTHVAMGKIAADDRGDPSAAYGGLIFYRAGQAEGTQYPSAAQGDNDLVYTPKLKGKYGTADYDFAKDQRDSLARFICHFDKVQNADRVGPTADELRDAQANNYYGLVLTSLSETTLAAYYFNPEGLVISLGIYPMQPPAK
jgi:hypothetical protein